MPILTFNITTIDGDDFLGPPVERADVLIVNQADGSSIASGNAPVVDPLTNAVTVDFLDTEFVAGFDFFLIDQSVPPVWLSTTDYSLDDSNTIASPATIQQGRDLVFSITAKLGDNASLPGGADSLSVGSFFVIQGGGRINLDHASVNYAALSDLEDDAGQYLATVDHTTLTTEAGGTFTPQAGDKFGLSTVAEIEPGVFVDGPVKFDTVVFDIEAYLATIRDAVTETAVSVAGSTTERYRGTIQIATGEGDREHCQSLRNCDGTYPDLIAESLSFQAWDRRRTVFIDAPATGTSTGFCVTIPTQGKQIMNAEWSLRDASSRVVASGPFQVIGRP